MSKVSAVLDRIEAQQRDDAIIPDDIPLLVLAEMHVRGKIKLSSSQASMLKELLPFHANKLPSREKKDEKSFATRLDRAKVRSAGVQSPPVQIDDSSLDD
jgi:hypothetical protein